MGTRAIANVAVTTLLGLFLASPSTSADVVVSVYQSAWRLETPLGIAEGPCLVVLDSPSAGTWRCEIAVAESPVQPTRSSLLLRRGRGWTLAGIADDGFAQGWGEPWRALGADASSVIAALLVCWAAPPEDVRPSSAGRHRWRLDPPQGTTTVVLRDWTGLPEAWRPPGSGAASAGELRRRLTARGTGHGGDGLVLDLHRDAGELRITSARWPGRITIAAALAETATVPSEAFLPLWPLAEFLD